MKKEKSSSIPIIAILVSVTSLLITFLTYNRNSPHNELIRRQDEKMQLIASRAAMVFIQLKTLSKVQTDTTIKFDPYLLPSYQKNIQRLEENIDEALGMGLYQELIGDSGKSIEMNVAFRQDLAWMETLDYKTADISQWTSLHFFYGMIRLMDKCLSYRKNLLPATLSKEINSRIEPLRKEAWNYMGK